MPTATLTSKGQVTIPKAVREHLKIDEGDRLVFVIDSEGEVSVKPVTKSFRRLRGLLRDPRCKPVSVEQMNEAIRKRFRRSS